MSSVRPSAVGPAASGAAGARSRVRRCRSLRPAGAVVIIDYLPDAPAGPPRQVTMTTRVRLTYEDYAALPDDGRRYELHEGELSVTPAPRARHQETLAKLFVIL